MSIPLYGNEEKGLAGSLDSLLFTLCITQRDFPPYLSLTVWQKISFHIKVDLGFQWKYLSWLNQFNRIKIIGNWKNPFFYRFITEVSDGIWVLGTFLLKFSNILLYNTLYIQQNNWEICIRKFLRPNYLQLSGLSSSEIHKSEIHKLEEHVSKYIK